LVENLTTSATYGTADMNQEPQRVAREGVNRASRDGLAAVAIAILTISLIALVVIKII
jgi:hypothetical protein